MQQLSLIPYQQTDGINMDIEIEIDLTDVLFQDIAFIDGQTTFAIFNRVFKTVIIKNSEAINFKEISIAFFGCAIANIKIEEITSKNISIGFYGCVVNGRIKSENISSVELINCLCYANLFILEVERLRIHYSKSNLKLKRWSQLFKLMRVVDRITFWLEKQSIYINDVKHISFTSELNYRGLKSKIDLHLSIAYNDQITDTKTTIDNAYLRSLSLTGKSSGSISIDNTKVENVYISEFSPKEDASFFNIESVREKKEESKISIHRSDLSKVWFDNVDFAQFDRISFYRSKFSKTIFMSCSFPDDYARFKTFSQDANIHYPNKKGPNPAKDNYEMFLQLKASLEGTGNYYEGQKLQAMAHEALKDIKDIPCGDKIILGLNSFSNKHALSISKPFGLFIGSTIVLYIIYLSLIDQLYLSTSPDWKLIGFYFSFIDITHRNDFLIEKGKLTFGGQLIDYLNKLLMSYLIFQFISAFRKYSKK